MPVIVVIVAAVMVGIGSVAALLWWWLADKTFPGAAAKTGQGLRTRHDERHEGGGVVITGFDDDAAAKGPGA